MHPTFATDPGFVDRFEREARAAARLNSQYAVGVHDQGNDAGVTYLVMEYVPGHTVRDVLRAHGPLPPPRPSRSSTRSSRRSPPPTGPATSTGTSSPRTS